MRNVETKRLGDLIRLQRGISWDATQERDQPGDGTWPILGITNVQQRLVLDRLVHLKIPGLKPAAANLASFGTILMVGSNGNPTRVGNAVFIDRDDGFLFASFLIGARMRDTADADPKFLFYFIASPAVQAALTGSVRGTTGLQNLSQKFVEGLRVPTPPLLEQRQIAAILDTIDDALRKTEQIIAKLEQVKQGLLHDLLTRGIDDNGELRDPERHPEQFKDSPLGRIPKVWDVDTLIGVADVDRGKFTHRPRNDPDFYGGCYPFIQTGDVAAAEGGVLSVASQSLNERGAAVSREFPAGTIAITIAANIADTTVLGVPMFFPDSVVGAVVRDSNVVRFVQLCIQRAKPLLDARAPQSAQKNINLQDLRPLLIARPDADEQHRIAQCFDALVTVLERESNALDKLRVLKTGLMEDLLTGRVRVTPLLETAAE